jgi:putative ABC transport system permease protein
MWRRPTRSLLTVLGVGVGVAAGVSMAGIAWGFQRGVDRTFDVRGTDMVVTRMTKRNPMPSVFDEDCASEIALLSGVLAVAKADWEYMTIDDEKSAVVFGWETGSYLWDHISMSEGEIQSGEDAKTSIYLGVLCAEMLGKNTGDLVRIDKLELRVAGIFHSDSLVENSAGVLPLEVFQLANGKQGKVKHLNLRLAPEITKDEVEGLRHSIEAKFRGLRALHAGELAQKSTGVQMAKAMSIATASIALLVGTLGMMNTLLMSVFERTAEIGLLMAVGWSRMRVMALVLFESITLSMCGAVFGIIAGIGAVRIMEKMEFMNGKIEGDFSPTLIGTVLIIVAALGILGGLYPASRAASMTPHKALRAE